MLPPWFQKGRTSAKGWKVAVIDQIEAHSVEETVLRLEGQLDPLMD
jgi:hypothetical protein